MKKIIFIYLLSVIIGMQCSLDRDNEQRKYEIENEENLTTLQRIKKRAAEASQYIYENKGKIIAGTAALGALAYGAYNREKLLEHLNNLIKRYRSTPLKSSDIESRWNSLHFADQDDTNLNDAGSINNRYDESKRIKHFADEEDTDDTSKSTTEHSPVNHTILDETLNKKAVDEKNNDDFKDPYDQSPQSQSSQKKGDYFNDEIDHLQKKYSSNPDMIKRLENFREATNNNDIITAIDLDIPNHLTETERARLRASFLNKNHLIGHIDKPFNERIATDLANDHSLKKYDDYIIDKSYNPKDSESIRNHIEDIVRKKNAEKLRNDLKSLSDDEFFDQNSDNYSLPKSNYYNAYNPIKSREKVNKHFADEYDDNDLE